jgi:hypothetical protein
MVPKHTMQSARQQLQHNQRGGRPQYRYQRWTPPPEPKPEPKLDLSDKSFPSLPLSNVPQTQSTGGYDFATKFSTTVKVMSEMEKLQELREARDREATRQERHAMKGVYTGRFQPGRLTTTRLEEPEEDTWRPRQEAREPAEDEWVEVRHSKAHKTAHVKTTEELEEDYDDKAGDEEAADDYNGDLFDRSHRHDHYAT